MRKIIGNHPVRNVRRLKIFIVIVCIAALAATSLQMDSLVINAAETTENNSLTTSVEGGLAVTKSVTSDLEADHSQKFSFFVILDDTTVNGTYGGMTFTDGVARFELADGESCVAEGLAKGVGYTVEEEANGSFTTTSTGETGTIDDTEVSVAAFTNTRKTGGFSVSKTVESSTASDKNKEFHFTVTLDDTSINGTYGEMEFEDGIATFVLKDGESKSAEGLPIFVDYTVVEEEANKDNFVTTSSNTEGQISSDSSPEATFVNTKVEGGLAVTKSVTSDLKADHSQKFSFKVTLDDTTVNGTYGGMTFTDGVAEFKLADGESCVAEGLATDIGYTVEEEADGNFTTTSTGETGMISNDVSTAAFTNTRKTGGFSVSKTVESSTASDKNKEFHFTVTLDDTSINGTYGEMEFEDGVATFVLKDGESKSAEGLPTTVGYTVVEEEANKDNFVTTSSNTEGQISKDSSPEVVFVSTKVEGCLTVTKSVTSDLKADHSQKFSLKVTLDDTSINGTYGDMTFINGVAEFQLADGESKSAEGLPVEIGYTVTEAETKGFVTERTGDKGTINTEKAFALFTNTRETGGFSASKKVMSSTASDKNKKFYFTVTLDDTSINGIYGEMEFKDGVATFVLKDGESKSAEGLPTTLGYTVIEEEVNEDNFVTTSSNTKGQINKDSSPEVVFVSTKVEGGLTVTKSVTSDLKADHSKKFSFTVKLDDTTVNGTYGDMTFTDGVAEFELADGESCIAEGLGKGIGYTVEEEAEENFTTTSTGETGTIDDTEVSVAAFTNTRETGGFSVSKTVESSTASDKRKEFHFTVTLDDTSINGTYSEMEFKDGVATFILKDGESKSAEGLPTTVGYTVIEEEVNEDNFVTTSSNTKGQISKDSSPEVVFVSTKVEGGLTVIKSVTSDLKADHSQKFSFTVTLDDTSINGTYGDMTFTNGVGEFQLADGESKSAEGLPVGIGYTVTEAEAMGFVTESTGDKGTINTEKAAALFTNTRETGGFSVSKKVVSSTASDKSKEFHFTVTLDDTSINGIYGEMEFKDGVATFVLKDGESKSAEGLPATISYTVEEKEANKDDFVTTSSNTKGQISKDSSPEAAFVNTKVDSDSAGARTGDDANIVLWCILAAASAAGAAAIFLTNKRKKVQKS